MIITCEACGTSFRLRTSRVKESGSKVRCSKCKHVFVVYPPRRVAEPEPVEAEGGSVEGTATMEFFGAIEEEARRSEESARAPQESPGEMRGAQTTQARLKEEGDTLSDLRAMIESEEGRSEEPEEDLDSLFGDSFSGFSDAGAQQEEAGVPLSELESGDSPETEIVPLEALQASAPAAEEPEWDLDALAAAAPADRETGGQETKEESAAFDELDFDDLDFGGQAEPGEEPVDLGDLTVDTPASPLGAAENPTVDFGELDAETADFGETAAEESGAGEDLLDLSVFEHQASAVSREAEAEIETEAAFGAETDFDAEKDRDAQIAFEADARETVDLSELEMTTGETVDLDKMEAAPSAAEDTFADQSGGDDGALVEEDLDFGDLEITTEEEEPEEASPAKGGEDTILENFETGRPGQEKEPADAAGDTEFSEEFGRDDAESSPEGDFEQKPEEDALDLDLDSAFGESGDDGEADEPGEEEFDLDLDLGMEPESPGDTEGAASAGEAGEDLDLDLDLDFGSEGEDAGESDTGDAGEEFELDLEKDMDLEKDLDRELGLDSGREESTEDSDAADTDGEDWALNLDDLDLDLDTEEVSGDTFDLEEDEAGEEFELDLDLDDAEEAPGAGADEAGEDEFELDLDLDAEPESPAGGQGPQAPAEEAG
ncbi:MAG TPA: zinc-ribbon domain-containing protein, partial [Desulfosalsimonadaceae bacterium]|nr:zinc-ribbon domain-containing protein [Desulfosalsimonadaceae bacterium]